ncbi:MAG: redoxin family protein [Verrucomicrobiota bacterium]|nr:redoxin family protein [Verrucomicrobiota bacterium]
MINFSRFAKLGLILLMLAGARPGFANPKEFLVQSATGTNVFKLSEAKGKFVALHFLLKTECPYCIRHTQDYAQKTAGDSRVIHIFLKPDTEAEISQWAGKLGDDLPKLNIYRDPDAKLAKEFNIPDGYKFHGQTVHFPALVLLNGEGKEVFRYIGKSNGDRFSYEQFSAKLKDLTEAPAR